ncbi:PH domain-containing protein [Flammeovirga sp. SJP92]|uniref:PH domain-containing protein n=1 Tax=Flammeovirga sp. SJP92 TaxID=1775430 RepID=UPI0007885E43|nr:PH domain-containing protein [Flammeovirga sp. SJP92]KXX70880.1 hypothetical protein AVL50_10940 [Flammeovirga sp. SJP92]
MYQKKRQNYKSKFDLIKDKDEEILWEDKPVFLPFISVGILQITLGLLIPLIIVLINYIGKFDLDYESYHWNVLIIFGIQFLFGLYQIFYNIFNYSNTSFAFTNKRVMFSSGYSFVDFKTIDYDNILELEVKANFIEKMFNVGTIRFFNGRTKHDEGNTTKLYDEWNSIKDVLTVYQMVKQISFDFKHSNNSKFSTNPSYKINNNYTQR